MYSANSSVKGNCDNSPRNLTEVSGHSNNYNNNLSIHNIGNLDLNDASTPSHFASPIHNGNMSENKITNYYLKVDNDVLNGYNYEQIN